MLLDFGEGESIDEEELIYRTFPRALEARVMIMRNRLPNQTARNHLLEDGPDKDDAATRAWSVSVRLFYRAGGLPWRLAHMQPQTCFVGVSFHRLHTTKRQALYASMAQAFSTDIEGFVLRSERIPWREDQQPHLTTERAERLGSQNLAEYRKRAGRSPVRVTLHKTTRFSPEEREGFTSAFSEVATVELLTLPLSLQRDKPHAILNSESVGRVLSPDRAARPPVRNAIQTPSPGTRHSSSRCASLCGWLPQHDQVVI